MGQAVFKIKYKWREIVLEMYRQYGNKTFYSSGMSDIWDRFGKDLKIGLFAYLRSNGVIQMKSGSKRSHVPRENEPNLWCFTDSFLKYMRDGGEDFYVNNGGEAVAEVQA